MKKEALFLALLLLAGLASAQEAEEIFTSESLSIDMGISTQLTIEPTSSNFDVDFVKANVTAYPRESTILTISKFSTEPVANQDADSLLFLWDSPSEKQLQLSIDTEFVNQKNFPKVQNKVSFPIRNLEGFEEYKVLLK